MKKCYLHQKIVFPTELIQEAISEWKNKHLDEYYDISTYRENLSLALSKTRAYNLRVPNIDWSNKEVTLEATRDCMDFIDRELFTNFPAIRRLIHHVGEQEFVGWNTLGRVFISRLDPNSSIGRHIDQGTYFDSLHRFHVPLETKGSMFCWDTDSVQLEAGYLYRLNNSVPHWVQNSSTFRTHLIFDGV